MKKITLPFMCTLIFMACILHAQLYTDIETGRVFSGYNNVQIPGNTGTRFSLSEDLTTDSRFFLRSRLFYSFNNKHTVGILIAPLRLEASGKIDEPVTFEGETFSGNVPLKATYRFDSYRFTYRYTFYSSGNLNFGAGLTAKIRDASISVEGENKKSEKKNTGFVPLINFLLRYNVVKELDFVLDGDALGSPQDRAEDVFVGFEYFFHDAMGFKAGYRILEGGADVEEVYNFTLLHYVVAGFTLFF